MRAGRYSVPAFFVPTETDSADSQPLNYAYNRKSHAGSFRWIFVKNLLIHVFEHSIEIG
jgi:hypothetical protein